MFIRFFDDHIMIFLIYVDIILTGNSELHLQQFIALLSAQFYMKDLGPLHYFLGREVSSTKQGLLITQTEYVVHLLQSFGLDGPKSVSTPIAGSRLNNVDGDLLSNPIEFRQLVGALQYLTMTCPDISYAVTSVSIHALPTYALFNCSQKESQIY